eukprot:scaffold368_cov49-Phaeocystis_antarctica.AAC.1
MTRERSRAGGSRCATPTEKSTQEGFFPSQKRSCGTRPCAPILVYCRKEKSATETDKMPQLRFWARSPMRYQALDTVLVAPATGSTHPLSDSALCMSVGTICPSTDRDTGLQWYIYSSVPIRTWAADPGGLPKNGGCLLPPVVYIAPGGVPYRPRARDRSPAARAALIGRFKDEGKDNRHTERHQ